MSAESSTGVVLGVVGFIISSLLGLVVALIAYINSQQRHETAKEIEALKGEMAKKDTVIDKLKDRLGEEERATTRLDGELKLVKSEQSNLQADIHDIKKNMVTKVEFDSQMNNLTKLVGMVLQKQDGTRYPSTQIPAVRSNPETYPPKRGGG